MTSMLSSDEGVDSPTYDGDVESSSTLIAKNATSNASTPLASPPFTPTSSADHRRLPPVSASSQPTDLNTETSTVDEPRPPPSVAAAKFNPANFTAEDIQAFVAAAINGTTPRTYTINQPAAGATVRIYADGRFVLMLIRLCLMFLCM